MNIKKVTVGILGTLILGAGGAGVTDAKINPYEDVGDRLKVEVVQTLQETGVAEIELIKTRPEVRFKKWDGEVDLGISYSNVKGSGKRARLTNRMEWKGANEEVHAYPIDDENFEIEIVLKKKPNTNIFEFQIDGYENLDFFYQPELTQEEIDLGDFRPENVVGSYAVYHKTKSSHAIGDTNYATGKVFHIYRPKAIDADGVEKWAVLDYQSGILSVTVPQNFLDNSTYPIRIDPTFGNTVIGASFASHLIDRVNGDVHTLPDIEVDVSKITWYMENVNGSSAQTAFYSGNDFVDTSDTATPNSGNAWYDFTFTPDERLSAGDYYISFWSSGGSHSSCPDCSRGKYDAGSTNQTRADFPQTYNTWPDPFTQNSEQDRTFSIYATYTIIPQPLVTTATSTAQGDTTATLDGELTALGDIGEVSLGFELGIDAFGTETGFDATTTVETATSSLGAFLSAETGLTTFEEYGYRAWVAGTTTATTTGETHQFFTGDISTSTPVLITERHAWDLGDFSNGSTTLSEGTTLLILTDAGGGSPTAPTLVATTTQRIEAGNTEDVTLPGSPVANDLIIVYGVSDFNNDEIVMNTSGYTVLFDSPDALPEGKIWYKKMGSTPDTLVNVTKISTTARDAGITVENWRGVDAGTAIDDTRTTATGTSGDPNCPSFTTVTDNAKFICVGLQDDDVLTSVTPPAGFTQLTFFSGDPDANASDGLMTSSKTITPTGATDPDVYVSSGDDAWDAVSFALRPRTTNYSNGAWTSVSWEITGVDSVDDSHIEFSSSTPSDTAVRVMVAVNSSGSTQPAEGDFTEVASAGNMSAGGVTGDLTGKFVWVRIEMDASGDAKDTPSVSQLIMAINDGVAGAADSNAIGNFQCISGKCEIRSGRLQVK